MNGLPAALCAGVAIWCSFGTIGITSAASTSTRLALLAPWWLLPLSIAAVFGVIRLLRLSPREQSPLFATIIAVLPWLPIPLPPAALIWAGPFLVTVWVSVIIGLLSTRTGYGRVAWFTDPRRAPFAAAILSLVLYGVSAIWLSPILPDGDEPHYLILAQSLIKDGDLRIENNHRQGDYLAYSLTAAAPDYLRRGVNGEIYSIHAPGLPVLIAPPMWLWGYRGVVAFLALIAALSTALVWRLGYGATGNSGAAWFGWACCASTAPFFFQATEVFPDGIAATFLLIGTLPLFKDAATRRRDATIPNAPAEWIWIVSGASLALLPWLQTRLAVLAIAAASCVLLRIRRIGQLFAFLAVPLVAAAAWFGFFVVVYGTPNPTAPYGPYTQTSIANLVRGIPGLLFDQQFGLIPNAPVYGFVIGGLLWALVTLRRWGWETLLVIVPYMTAVGTYQMWWGGTSVPARLLTPITLVVGVAAARVWQQVSTRASRTLGLLAMIGSVVITATLLGVDHGRLLLNFRDGVSLWLEYANDVVDLPKGLPSLFRDDRTLQWVKVAIWTIAAMAVWGALRLIERRNAKQSSPLVLSSSAIGCAAIVVMLAFSAAWQVDGSRPLTPATAAINLLRHATPFRSVAFDVETSRFSRADTRLSNVAIAVDTQRRPLQSPVLFEARDLPAGAYQVHASEGEPAAGTLTARVGATPLPFQNLSAAAVERASADALLRLPVGVRMLSIEGAATATRSMSNLEILRVEGPPSQITRAAHRAVHYEAADVFFFDEHGYPEPSGFWAAGGRTTEVALAVGPLTKLLLRNAPVDNHVTLQVDDETRNLTLAPGEEQLVALPQTAGRAFVRVHIRSESGFRPAVIEPGSTDQRYLGCWVELRR